MEGDLYIGLISGTSVDGVDAALVSLADEHPRLIATHLHAYSSDLRHSLHELFVPGNGEIDRLGEIDNLVGETFASAALQLLDLAKVPAARIRAIGCHGQTVRHRPLAKHPFTLQIGNPYVVAERTGLDVVWDFRRRDMVAGGQGAPLAPLFHQAFMGSATETRIVLNLGGIANITRLPRSAEPPVAFDTGPANGLMDAWIQRVQGVPFDRNGAWAASATADPDLLSLFLTDPYFAMPAPKSTGKEWFHLPWAERLADLAAFDPAVVQATFLALTVESIARAIEASGGCDRVLACGGGVHNSTLLKALQDRVGVPVDSSASVGVEPDWVEAMTFAWLAACHLEGRKLDSSPFTGAGKPVILGSLVPGYR